jgi:serine protease AprX
VYTYWREGGMSWAAPYLGGLAAMAFQVNPEIAPAKIIELWKQTATKTDAGPIVNPVGFIEAAKKSKAGG